MEPREEPTFAVLLKIISVLLLLVGVVSPIAAAMDGGRVESGFKFAGVCVVFLAPSFYWMSSVVRLLDRIAGSLEAKQETPRSLPAPASPKASKVFLPTTQSGGDDKAGVPTYKV